uniref:BTB domain-containing protein n=1 Tax=Panagrolaimus davidi TaxID=227884 RepID=A0A914Q479_9BILA
MKSNDIICPIDSEWKFHKADLIPLKDSEDGFLNGKCFYGFNIHGLQYFVKIYPNGNRKEYRGKAFFFFHVNGSNERNITAELTLSIESADYSKELNYVYETATGYGAIFCKTTKFFDLKSKFFVDGEIMIKVKGILKARRSLISKISTPISMQWKIKAEDLHAKKEESNDGYLCSKEIEVASFSGVKYSLFIYPNKIEGSNQSETFLYLVVETGKEKKVEAVYDFSIVSAKYNCGNQYIFEELHGWGSFLCLTKDLFDPENGFIVNGFLTVNFNGILMKDNNRFTGLSSIGVFSKDDEKKFEKDFTIVVGKKRIKVHKHALIDASPVFTGMFNSGMKETLERKMIIKDFPFKIVDVAVKLLYNVNILRKFSTEDMLLLYKFAEKYEIKHIMDFVENYLIKKLSPANVVQFVHFSKEFHVTKLQHICIEFLVKCYKESTPIYAMESLNKEFVVSIFLNTWHPIVDSVIEG